MNDLMVDIETMGQKASAPIVAIGAVFFDPSSGELGEKLYRGIALESAMANGAIPDANTIIWWMKQSSEVRAVLRDEHATELRAALTAFSSFIRLYSTDPDCLRVWGNGPSFDNSILRETYQREAIEEPWKWYNDRDVRTLVELGRAAGFDPKRNMSFYGIEHHALDDAVHQAKYVSAIWQQLVPPRSKNIIE